MSIKSKIGNGITNFLYPYIQNYTKGRGGDMPKQAMEYEEYCLQEKYLWFLGNEDLLADFYQSKTPRTTIIDTRASYYYSNVDNKIRVIHSGIPSLISYGKSNLLLTGGIETIVGKDDKENQKDTDLLKSILKDNDFENTILSNSVATESWSSKFALKISFDKDISKYPIIEKYNPFNYKAIYKRGRIQEIIFTDELYEDYQLDEIYGWGYIKYELYKIAKDGTRNKVSLDELIDTAEYEDETFNENMMLAVEKKIDKSDYQGIMAEFDALDETWSQLMDEVRTARAETYIPDILTVGKTFNDFRKKYVVTGSDERENGKNEISHNQPDIRVEQYTKASVAIRDNILANVHLNPLTIGIDDTIGANASAESIERRETVSLRTRKGMIDTWKPFLENFYNTLLNAYNWYFKNKSTFVEYTITTIFGDYITPNIETRIDNVVKMKNADIIDDEKALDVIYGDNLSEEEKNRILSNLGNETLSLEEE